jgi:ketosteroid isomerase-like protein
VSIPNRVFGSRVKPRFFLAGAMILVGGFVAQAAPSKPSPVPFSPPTVLPMSSAECNVWRRERSFAESVDRHDTLAFSQHISANAVFVSDDPKPVRGRNAIVEEWAGFISGEPYSLHWYPGSVDIAGDAKVALSRGLYWLESGKSAPSKKYAIGHFVSVWTEEPDGVWRVIYDGGNTDRPVPATKLDIQRLKASLPQDCPRSVSFTEDHRFDFTTDWLSTGIRFA